MDKVECLWHNVFFYIFPFYLSLYFVRARYHFNSMWNLLETKISDILCQFSQQLFLYFNLIFFFSAQKFYINFNPLHVCNWNFKWRWVGDRMNGVVLDSRQYINQTKSSGTWKHSNKNFRHSALRPVIRYHCQIIRHLIIHFPLLNRKFYLLMKIYDFIFVAPFGRGIGISPVLQSMHTKFVCLIIISSILLSFHPNSLVIDQERCLHAVLASKSLCQLDNHSLHWVIAI